MDNKHNKAIISGQLVGLTESHSVLNEKFYVGQIRCTRLSGVDDIIPVTIPERLLGQKQLEEVIGPILIDGQIRSYNKIIDGSSRLCLTLFAQNLGIPEPGAPKNHIAIEGAVCRKPNFRVTPFGREICDLMIVVPRRLGKDDYIPSIVWGRNGRWASDLALGDRIVITGRLQSREYEKLLDSGDVEKRTTYEVSTFSIVRAEEEVRAPA